METVKHAVLAPFSDASAALTTPAKTAVAYGCIGFLVAMLLQK